MPILTEAQPRATSARVLSAGFDLVVGLRLLLPDEILGNPHNASYRLINAHFFGDIPLGLTLLVYGGVMAYGLRSDGAPKVLHIASWLSLLTWLLVAIDIGVVNLSQMGSLVYGLVVCLNAYAYTHVLTRQSQVRRAER